MIVTFNEKKPSECTNVEDLSNDEPRQKVDFFEVFRDLEVGSVPIGWLVSKDPCGQFRVVERPCAVNLTRGDHFERIPEIEITSFKSHQITER
tara:strand:+ start:275 stop:553 length:279 start_codon:yes stop_codon:yes gene_type:complete